MLETEGEDLGTRLAARAAIAVLTHPAVVAALVLLVVNDHQLKRWWPGWVTGKLSDFSWPLVAAPLVALALCPAARRCGHRRWMLASVILTGVPLVAVNVSAIAADALGRALTHVVGPSRITPDPSDLLVILPALYVSYRLFGSARVEAVREGRSSTSGVPAIRWGTLPLVGLAAFGTAATSCDESGLPAVLALSADGEILYADVNGEVAVSQDGGLSWQPFDGPDPFVALRAELRLPEYWQPRAEPVCLDEVCYRIEGFRVQAGTDGDQWETVWQSDHTRADILERQRLGGACPDTRPPTRPLDLEVLADPDAVTGHRVVVAAGLDGVLFGNREDGFEYIAVLRAEPPSRTGLSWRILAPEFAATSWLMALVWIGGSVVLWRRLRRVAHPGARRPRVIWPVLVTLLVPVVLVPLGLGWYLIYALFSFAASVPVAWALVAGAAAGWLVYPSPDGWRPAPWRLAGRTVLIGLATMVPFVLWALGLIPDRILAIAVAVVIVPIAAVFPWAPLAVPWTPEREEPSST